MVRTMLSTGKLSASRQPNNKQKMRYELNNHMHTFTNTGPDSKNRGGGVKAVVLNPSIKAKS